MLKALFSFYVERRMLTRVHVDFERCNVPFLRAKGDTDLHDRTKIAGFSCSQETIGS